MNSTIIKSTCGKLAVIAVIGVAAAMPTYAGQNLIVNGAFEDEGTYMPRISSRAKGTYAYFSDGEGFNASPWTFTGYAGLCGKPRSISVKSGDGYVHFWRGGASKFVDAKWENFDNSGASEANADLTMPHHFEVAAERLSDDFRLEYEEFNTSYQIHVDKLYEIGSQMSGDLRSKEISHDL